MKRCLILLALLLGIVPASAQKTIDQLSTGVTPTGNEYVPAFQTANPAVKLPLSGIVNALTITSISTGCAGYSAGAAITTVGEIDSSQASIAHVTTDTIGVSECGRLGTFNSGSAVAITLPQANASGLFLPGWYEDFVNYGAGLVTFTTTTSNFLNNGTHVITLAQGQSFRLVSSTASSGNWDVIVNAGTISSVSNSDGTLTISPTTGTVVGSLNLSHANTWAAVQTFTNSDIKLLGSSTGATTFSSANAGASNFTLTFPAATDTLAALGTAQTWTGAQTFGPVIGGVTSQSGTTYTFAQTDCGTTVRFTSNSAVTATIPTTLAAGCHIEAVQRGSAKVTVTGTAVSACTLTSSHSYTGTNGTAGSVILILMDAANTCILTGDGS